MNSIVHKNRQFSIFCNLSFERLAIYFQYKIYVTKMSEIQLIIKEILSKKHKGYN